MIDTCIHIGYPKNLSTTLQVDYFSKHDDIYHLGTGLSHNTGYKDSLLESYFENIFFYANELMYRNIKPDLQKHLDYHYDLFKKSDKKIFSLSLEHISFSFTPADADIYLKFKRLREIFGKNIKIIAVIRNQSDLIKSLYRESIRIGYPYSFKKYIDFLYNCQNFSYLLEFQYDKVIDILSDFFPVDNIIFIPIEFYRNKIGGLLPGKNNNDFLVNKLNDVLNIQDRPIVLSHNNIALSKKELYQKLQLNKKYKHELGNTVYEPVQRHRLKEYYRHYLNVEINGLFDDVKQKRFTLEMAKDLAKVDSREIDYYADPVILNKLENMFVQSNGRLKREYGINLPSCYFDMSF